MEPMASTKIVQGNLHDAKTAEDNSGIVKRRTLGILEIDLCVGSRKFAGNLEFLFLNTKSL